MSREASRTTILALVALLASLASLLGPPPASAHPLGQNSINHLTLVRISSDRIALLYILDQAEFLTLRQRDLTEEQIVAFKLEEVQRRLSVIVDGERRTPRRAGDPEIEFTPGVGGLPIMRLELPLEVRVSDPRRAVEHRSGQPVADDRRSHLAHDVSVDVGVRSRPPRLTRRQVKEIVELLGTRSATNISRRYSTTWRTSFGGRCRRVRTPRLS